MFHRWTQFTIIHKCLFRDYIKTNQKHGNLVLENVEITQSVSCGR